MSLLAGGAYYPDEQLLPLDRELKDRGHRSERRPRGRVRPLTRSEQVSGSSPLVGSFTSPRNFIRTYRSCADSRALRLVTMSWWAVGAQVYAGM